MAKAAVLMATKAILVCHNDTHVKVLKTILNKYICEDYNSGDPMASKFAPPDLQQTIDDAKPARLKAYEAQKKRGLPENEQASPDAKRAALADTWEEMLTAMESSGSGGLSGTRQRSKAKAPATPKPPPPKATLATAPTGGGTPTGQESKAAGAAPTGAAQGKAAGAAPTITPVTAPEADLTALLKQWA